MAAVKSISNPIPLIAPHSSHRRAIGPDPFTSATAVSTATPTSPAGAGAVGGGYGASKTMRSQCKVSVHLTQSVARPVATVAGTARGREVIPLALVGVAARWGHLIQSKDGSQAHHLKHS